MGFRERHSCGTVVVNLCDIFKRELDVGSFVLAVFLNFRRAFETVDRKILIKKLHCKSLSGMVLGWFESYLSNRHQRVKFLQHGVPQETILLYVNDIVGAVDRCCIELMFADDTMIYISGSNLNLMQTNVNNDLENIGNQMAM